MMSWRGSKVNWKFSSEKINKMFLIGHTIQLHVGIITILEDPSQSEMCHR